MLHKKMIIGILQIFIKKETFCRQFSSNLIIFLTHIFNLHVDFCILNLKTLYIIYIIVFHGCYKTK